MWLVSSHHVITASTSRWCSNTTVESASTSALWKESNVGHISCRCITSLSLCLQRPDSKNWRSDEREEELLCLSRPLYPNSALPSSLPVSDARSCREDVNWDWNNKQSWPLRHLQKGPGRKKLKAHERGTAVFGLELSPLTLILLAFTQGPCHKATSPSVRAI